MTSNTSAEEIFRQAFTRLKGSGKEISFNAVATEAGKVIGSIKKSRYPGLHSDIQEAIDKQNTKSIAHIKEKEKLKKSKKRMQIECKKWKEMYENQTEQIIILIQKIHQLETKIANLEKSLKVPRCL